MARTRLSSKGQVIIPKAVRDRHGWRPGLELDVEDQADAVVLRHEAVPELVQQHAGEDQSDQEEAEEDGAAAPGVAPAEEDPADL